MRTDIPEDLRQRVALVSPGMLAWLEAGYPTDAEHRKQVAKRQRAARVQLRLPLAQPTVQR